MIFSQMSHAMPDYTTPEIITCTVFGVTPSNSTSYSGTLSIAYLIVFFMLIQNENQEIPPHIPHET